MVHGTINGVPVEMELAPIERQDDFGAWRSGSVTLPDGRRYTCGGGWVHSADSARDANRRKGLQADSHPDLHWPGAVDVGDFAPYEGVENGDLAGLAAAVGMDIDRGTDTGDMNWRCLVDTLQSMSLAANNGLV